VSILITWAAQRNLCDFMNLTIFFFFMYIENHVDYFENTTYFPFQDLVGSGQWFKSMVWRTQDKADTMVQILLDWTDNK
jgi:hypothetical protein